MTIYLYSVWFENQFASDDDQDGEWIACISIEAATPIAAQEWGDTLARARGAREPAGVFLRSEIDDCPAFNHVTEWSSVPCILAGEQVSDKVIGW